MKVLKTTQTVTVRITQPADQSLPLGPLAPKTVERMRRDAMREAKATAGAQGAEVLEYTVHSVEVVEG